MNVLRAYVGTMRMGANDIKNLVPPIALQYRINHYLSTAAKRNGQADSPLILTHDPGEADWFILPRYWGTYLWNRKEKMHEAEALAQRASQNGKKLLIWHKGDLIPKIPFANAVVFLPGIIHSKRGTNHRACPVFVDDPLFELGLEQIEKRTKREKPVVGFCGYASMSLSKTLVSLLKGTHLNLMSALGRYDYDGIPIVPTPILRARALGLLARDPNVETEFLVRDRYTGPTPNGRTGMTNAHRFEYFSNISQTDYTVCLRGHGNWSYRFYETLACGRIPIFINTECVLPCEKQIPWKEYCVWVDRSNLKDIANILLDFHSSLSSSDFIDAQIAARRLWETQFTPQGFLCNLSAYLEN